MPLLVIAFIFSFVATMLLVRTTHLHNRFSGDVDLLGVQKFHTRTVPRIGGIAIMLGLCASGMILWLRHSALIIDFYLLLGVAAPAFFCGLYEDIRKHGGIAWRLIIVFVASAFAWWLVDAQVRRVDFAWGDALVQYPLFSLLFTAIAILGMTNAMNLIDGYNGLASAVAAIMLGGIAYVALLVDDYLIWSVSIATIGAILGFFVWNWPRGLIFLGDGGAYFLGFIVALLVVLLVARNPLVSPWFAALIVSYPVMETGFTIYRRLARKTNPGLPDAAHLHQLIYKRVIHWAAGSSTSDTKLQRNSMTSPYLWAMSSLGVIPAVLFWHNTLALQVAAFFFVVIYIWAYHTIVAFHLPRWIVSARSKKQP